MLAATGVTASQINKIALLTVCIANHVLIYCFRQTHHGGGNYFKSPLFVPTEIYMRCERALLKLLYQTDGFSGCLRNIEFLIKHVTQPK